MMDVTQSIPYLPGDARLVDHILCELKSQGIFDQFRKDCLADVDTKPAYQNLHQRVEGIVTEFLKQQAWKTDLNKNQLREKLRKHILELNFLDQGVDRIVDQVVNPKVASVFIPKVEEVVYRYLGIEVPHRPPTSVNGGYSNIRQILTVETNNLLPHDLEAVSPDSVKSHDHNEEVKNKNVEMYVDTRENSVSKDTKTSEDLVQNALHILQKKNDGGEKHSKSSNEQFVAVESPDSIKTNQEKDKSLNDTILSGISELSSVDSKNSSMVQDSQVEEQKTALDIDFQLSQVSTAIYPTTEKPMETEQIVEEIVEDACIDESSSEVNLRIDMSPLTPVRVYDHIDNSSDAQPAFDQSASFINKTGINFAIEKFKSIKSSQDRENEASSNLDEVSKGISDSDEFSAKSISQHRSSVESRNSSDSFKPVIQNDTDSCESKSSSVFESMIRAKMKILDEELNILELRSVDKIIEHDDSNGIFKENISSPIPKIYSSPDVNLSERSGSSKKIASSLECEKSQSEDILKDDPKYLDIPKKIDHKHHSHRHESVREEGKEKHSSSKEKYKDRHSSQKTISHSSHGSSKDDEKYKFDLTREDRKDKHHSSKDTHRHKHESSKSRHKDLHDSSRTLHKERHTSSTEVNKEKTVEKEDLEKEHRERRDTSKDKSKSREHTSREENKDRRSHKDSKPKDKVGVDFKKSNIKEKHGSDISSKYDKRESSSSGRHHSNSQKSSSKESRSNIHSSHSSKSKHHSSERHLTNQSKHDIKSDKNMDSNKNIDHDLNESKFQEQSSSGKHKDKQDRQKVTNSSSEKDKKRDEKKHKKPSDDHYSSSGRNRTRRSTDRDSNDGNSGFNKGSNFQSDTSTVDSQKTNDSNSKTYSTNNSNNSSSPNDSEVTTMKENENTRIDSQSVCLNNIHSETQIKKPVHLEQQLNTPFEASMAAIDMIYMQKVKKPKIATNATHALQLMRVRKEIDLQERRRHQAAVKLAEHKNNVPLSASQVFSGLSGPQVEITCENLVSSVKMDASFNDTNQDLDSNSGKNDKSEEIINEKESNIGSNLKVIQDKCNFYEITDLPSDEEDLLYYDQISANSLKTKHEKLTKFVSSIEKDFIKKYEKFVFLKNCSENIVTAFQKVLLRGPRLIINHMCIDGFKPSSITETSENLKTKDITRTKKVAFTPDLEAKNPVVKIEYNIANNMDKLIRCSEISVGQLNDTSNNYLEDTSDGLKHSSSLEEVTSPDGMDKINKKLKKPSKQEIIEIILGGVDMEYFSESTLNTPNSNEEKTSRDSRKRKIENSVQSQGTSLENNNQRKKSLNNKIRKLSGAEDVSSSNAVLTNGQTPHAGGGNSKMSSTASDLEMPLKRSSKFLGKPKNVGLSKVKTHCSANSKSLLREKSEDNYTKENSERLRSQNERPKRMVKSVYGDGGLKCLKGYVSKQPLTQENS